MRRSIHYRYFKKVVIVVFGIWAIYSISEMIFRSESSNSRDQIEIEPERFKIPNVGGSNGNLQRKENNLVVQQASNEKVVTQLDKLTALGGKLVEKKSPEFYNGINLPKFNDQIETLGPGEWGHAYTIDVNTLSKDEKALYDQGWKDNSFNQYLSDKISIFRKLPDNQSPACVKTAELYNKDLQELSVVIIFHNEAWSVLLRSVHSILSRTPQRLLREIVLVDDFSTKDHLGAPLEKYFNSYPKVQIVRAIKRQGLTRSRLLGYYVSTAPIVVFLDSHIECFPGWAEPLSYHIGQKPTLVAFPSIEVINDENFGTQANGNVNQNGIFRWKDLTFQWQSIPQFEADKRKSDADPIRSPTMPGGLFAIGRDFFERLGTYDPGLDYWGGENIELSFKAWMCGGSVELIPCSHIGHIFRRSNPIKWNINIGNKNSVRVAEVWMDDYKNYFYERILYTLGDYGNVTERKELRKKLNCHSFQWYIKNIYPNLVIPSKMKYAGEIRSFASPRCIDSMGGPEANIQEPKMYPCHGQGYNQFWYVTEDGQIRQDEWKICVAGNKIVGSTSCNVVGPNWLYRDDKTILHIPTGQCLTSGVSDDNLTLTKCFSDSKWQKWEMQLRRNDFTFPE